MLVCLDLRVLLEGVVLLVCLDREEREVSLACPDLLYVHIVILHILQYITAKCINESDRTRMLSMVFTTKYDPKSTNIK